MEERSYQLFIKDIIVCLKKILKYTDSVTYEEFINNQMIVDAVTRNFLVLGEATVHIPNKIKAKNNDIKWSQFEAYQNELINNYANIDHTKLWKDIQFFLPNQLVLVEILFENEIKT